MRQQYYKRVFAEPKEYKGIMFKSTMERDFAMFLDGQVVKYKGAIYYHPKIDWGYEVSAFELIPQEKWVDLTERDNTVKKARNKKHTLQRVIYTPDFYLPEYNIFVEVKGFQFEDELFRLRLRLFRHKYPGKKLWIIRHHEEFALIDKIIENSKLGGLL